jgi:hypothetical protein
MNCKRSTDIVMIHTGAAKWWGTPQYLRQPGLDRDSTLWLVGKGIHMDGIEPGPWTVNLRRGSKSSSDGRRPSDLAGPLCWNFEGADRERRTAKLSRPGVIEYRAEPIKNPVTGEEHGAQIRLPDGFEYCEAEMGNTTWLKVTVDSIAFEHRNSYAQFNAFDWSNGRPESDRIPRAHYP